MVNFLDSAPVSLHPAPDPVAGLKHCHPVSSTLQRVRRRQPCQPGPQHNHLLLRGGEEAGEAAAAAAEAAEEDVQQPGGLVTVLA